MLICSGSSNTPLAGEIAKVLHAKTVDRDISKFPNGEKRIWLTTSVKDQDVVLVQSFSQPVDEHIIELALLIDAANRAGAKTITVVIPWMGYSLQDDVFRVGESLAVKVVADMLSALPITKLLFIDLHSDKVLGLFSMPAKNISMGESFARHSKNQTGVVVFPDHGSSKRVKHFAELLGLPYVEIEKKRDRNNGSITMSEHDKDIKGKTCILIDDVINTGSTTILAAANFKKHGAKKVVVYATHIVAGPKHVAALDASKIDSIIVSNTVENVAIKSSKKIKVVSAAEVIAAALR